MTGTFVAVRHVDYKSTERDYHRAVSRIATRITPPGGSIVDVGCGSGQTLKLIAEAAPSLFQLDGIDADAECIAASRELLGGRATLSVGDAASLQMGHYSTVICSHVLEHVENPLLLLSVLSDLAMEDGRLILAVPNVITPRFLLNSLLRRDVTNPGHLYAWDVSHFSRLLDRSGLRVEYFESDSVSVVPGRIVSRTSKNFRFGRYLSRVFPWFSESIIAVCAHTA